MTDYSNRDEWSDGRLINEYADLHHANLRLCQNAMIGDSGELAMQLNHLRAMQSEIERRMAEPQWISVNERMPELHRSVLVWGSRAGWVRPEIAYRRYGRFGGHLFGWSLDFDGMPDTSSITYWQPLPEPPEGE